MICKHQHALTFLSAESQQASDDPLLLNGKLWTSRSRALCSETLQTKKDHRLYRQIETNSKIDKLITEYLYYLYLYLIP